MNYLDLEQAIANNPIACFLLWEAQNLQKMADSLDPINGADGIEIPETNQSLYDTVENIQSLAFSMIPEIVAQSKEDGYKFYDYFDTERMVHKVSSQEFLIIAKK